jgi:DNA gyrase subunit A
VLVTRQGRSIRFPENDVPLMGRTAQGVKGIGLRAGDGVIGMVVVRRESSLCTVTELGYGKRTPIGDYPVQKRGGLGTVTLDVSGRTGGVVAAKELIEGDELMIISAGGAATRVTADEVPEQGRATQGRQLLKPKAGDRIVEVARVAREGVESGGRSKRTADPAATIAVEPAEEPVEQSAEEPVGAASDAAEASRAASRRSGADDDSDQLELID